MNNKIKYKHQMLLLQALLRKYERTYNKDRKKAILNEMETLKASLKLLRKTLVAERKQKELERETKTT